MRRCTLLAAVAGLALPSIATAQWISFSDETNTRLQLDGIGINDTEEKDILVVDLDKDGWDDVIVVRKKPFSTIGPRQDVVLMNENGVLVDKTSEYAPGFLSDMTDARDVLAADFDGDGWEDIVVCTTFDDPPKYYRNMGAATSCPADCNEDGTLNILDFTCFQAAFEAGEGDFNEDGEANILDFIAFQAAFEAGCEGAGEWLGLADESESRMSYTGVIGNQSKPFKMCAVKAGDLDNDGDLDMYWSNYEGGKDLALYNDGNGFFTDKTLEKLGSGSLSLAESAFGTQNEIIDVDEDGDSDIVKNTTLFSNSPFGIGVYILWNNGAPNYDFTNFSALPGTNSPYMFAMGDINDDNDVDIYVVQDPQDSIHRSTVNGPSNVSWDTFQPSPSPRTTGFGGNVYLADLDNDGDLDTMVNPVDVDIQNCVPNNQGTDLALLRNDGTGAMSDPWPSFQDQNFHLTSHDAVPIDINNDGKLDIFQGLCTGYNVFIQN